MRCECPPRSRSDPRVTRGALLERKVCVSFYLRLRRTLTVAVIVTGCSAQKSW
jgi:hypothetical protein